MGLVPIVYMKIVIESLINYISTNLSQNIQAGTEDQAFLYKIWHDIVENQYDFYNEAKEIFGRTKYHPHKLNVSLQYNKNIKEVPNIWLREPARRNGSFNSIGSIAEGEIVSSDFISGYRDTKSSNYELIISSNNSLATILVCETIYQVLLGAHDTLANLFPLFNFSMKELIANNELTPLPIIMKSIELDVQMEITTPSILSEDIISQINFTQNIYES